MRNLLYGISQMYPPKSKWSADDMPDLTGKVAMVTGTFTEMVFSSRKITYRIDYTPLFWASQEGTVGSEGKQ